MKEDSLISSTASLASLSKAGTRGRSRSSGSDGIPPLWISRDPVHLVSVNGLLLRFAVRVRSVVVGVGA